MHAPPTLSGIGPPKNWAQYPPFGSKSKIKTLVETGPAPPPKLPRMKTRARLPLHPTVRQTVLWTLASSTPIRRNPEHGSPRQTRQTCAPRGIKLLHISTDAVFDGTKEGVYTEDDAPNPLSVYAPDQTRWRKPVLDANPDAIVARVNFFGWSLNRTRSLTEFFRNNLGPGKELRASTKFYFCPIFVGDLADTLVGMLGKTFRGGTPVRSRAITK